MLRLEAGPGEVGDFVVDEAGGGEDRAGSLKHRDFPLLVLTPFAALEFLEEWRVLLVSQRVGGDVLRRAGERGLEGFFPLCLALRRQREHEIDVNVVEAMRAQ
jgi:hypothetical protein